MEGHGHCMVGCCHAMPPMALLWELQSQTGRESEHSRQWLPPDTHTNMPFAVRAKVQCDRHNSSENIAGNWKIVHFMHSEWLTWEMETWW